MSNPVADLIDAADGAANLAKCLGVSTQFLYRCRARGWLPLERATQCEDLFGVSRETLIKPALKQFITGE